jgi:hypothetical protein
MGRGFERFIMRTLEPRECTSTASCDAAGQGAGERKEGGGAIVSFDGGDRITHIFHVHRVLSIRRIATLRCRIP